MNTFLITTAVTFFVINGIVIFNAQRYGRRARGQASMTRRGYGYPV